MTDVYRPKGAGLDFLGLVGPRRAGLAIFRYVQVLQRAAAVRGSDLDPRSIGELERFGVLPDQRMRVTDIGPQVRIRKLDLVELLFRVIQAVIDDARVEVRNEQAFVKDFQRNFGRKPELPRLEDDVEIPALTPPTPLRLIADEPDFLAVFVLDPVEVIDPPFRIVDGGFPDFHRQQAIKLRLVLRIQRPDIGPRIADVGEDIHSNKEKRLCGPGATPARRSLIRDGTRNRSSTAIVEGRWAGAVGVGIPSARNGPSIEPLGLIPVSIFAAGLLSPPPQPRSGFPDYFGIGTAPSAGLLGRVPPGLELPPVGLGFCVP